MKAFFIRLKNVMMPASDAREPELLTGLDALGLTLDPTAITRLLNYLDLLAHWNRVYNLTAVAQPREMVARHLLDSLAILPWMRGRIVLDAGTGAGLPGVPLAIARPDWTLRLVDSNGKRIRFLRHVRRTLGLSNAWPEQSRLETLDPEPRPDEIVARALAPLPRLVDWLAPLLAGGARLLAMKGRLEQEEIEAIAPAYATEVVTLDIPGQTGRRSLIIIEKL